MVLSKTNVKGIRLKPDKVLIPPLIVPEGSVVSWKDPLSEAINPRLSQAHIAYGKLSAFWKAAVPKKTRLAIFRPYVVSVLLYGLSTLTLEDKHLQEDRQLVLSVSAKSRRHQGLLLLQNHK